MAKQPDVMLTGDAPAAGFEPYRPSAAPAKGKKRREDVRLPAEMAAPAASPAGVDASRFMNAAPEPQLTPQPAPARAKGVAPIDVVTGAVGTRGGRTDPSVAQRAREREARERPATQEPAAEPSSVADRIRAGGRESARAGLAILSEADRKKAVKVANRDHAPIKGYTDAMQGGAPVRRKGIFDPERVARARTGLTNLSQPSASSTATSSPGAPAAALPVQVVIQQPSAPPAAPSSGRAVPAGAAPGRAPGELPSSSTPAEPIPLEGEPSPGQVEAQAEPTPEELEADQRAREGIMQRQLDSEEQLAGARVGVAQAEADAMAEASSRYQNALGQAEQAKAEQDARVAEQLAASEEANRLVQRTAMEAIDAAAVDPKRAWATMGLGRKIAFALSSIAGGIGGSADPMKYVNKYIEQDIEQQRQGAAKAEANVGTARAAAAEQDNLYQRTLQAVGDDRVSADVVRVARIEQIQADLKARLSAAGVRQVSAEQQAFLTKLEEDKAAAQARIQSQAAHNPEYFVKTAYVHGKGTREGMRLMGKGIIESGVGSTERAEKQEGAVELEGIKLEGEREKARIGAAAEQRKAEIASEKDIKEKTLKWGQVETMIDDLLNSRPGEMYTVGLPGMGSKGERVEEEQFFKLLPEILTTAVTGAVASPEQQETFKELVQGDWSDFTDEDRRARLRALKNLASAQRRYLQNEVGSARPDVFDPKSVPSFQPR